MGGIGDFFKKIGHAIDKSNNDIKQTLQKPIHDIDKGFQKVIIRDVGNVLKNPNNPDLKKAIGYTASIVQLVPIVGPILVFAGTAIGDAVTKGKASEYLDKNNNSTLNMLPGMNLAQRIADDSSKGKSSDFLKNQFLDPKRDIMDNFHSGHLYKPINLVPPWVRKEIPFLANISDTISHHTIDPVLNTLDKIKNKNDIYIKDLMHEDFIGKYHTYPDMNHMRNRDPFDFKYRLHLDNQKVNDEKINQTYIPPPIQIQPPFPSNKFNPIDKGVQMEMTKQVQSPEIDYTSLLIPFGVGLVVLFLVVKR